MAHALPHHKRRAIVDLADAGHTYPEIASTLDVSLTSVWRYVAQSRRTGTIKDFHPWLRHMIGQCPEITPGELQARLARRNAHFSRGEIKQALRALSENLPAQS